PVSLAPARTLGARRVKGCEAAYETDKVAFAARLHLRSISLHPAVRASSARVLRMRPGMATTGMALVCGSLLRARVASHPSIPVRSRSITIAFRTALSCDLECGEA